jgi:hypothetical protein
VAALVEELAPAAPGPTADAARSALGSATTDIAPTLTDAVRQSTSTGTDATVRQETPEVRGITNLQGTSSIIRIIFRRPL